MNSNFPKITVGIPTYNQSKFIAETIKSALNQTYPNLEIIISDDASTDATEQIVAPFLNDNRLIYHRQKQNIGRVANYQKLFYGYATGDFYLNLDGDDLLIDPNFLTEAIAALPDDGVFYQSFAAVLLPNGQTIGEHPFPKNKKNTQPTTHNSQLTTHNTQHTTHNTQLLRGSDFVKNYFNQPYFAHCATVFDRKKALPLNFYSHDALNTDFDSLMRLAFHGSVVLSEKKVAAWRVHDENESNKMHEKKRNTPETETFERIAAASREFWTAKETQTWLSTAYDWNARQYWFQLYTTHKTWASFWTLLPSAFRSFYCVKLVLRLAFELIFNKKQNPKSVLTN